MQIAAQTASIVLKFGFIPRSSSTVKAIHPGGLIRVEDNY
jgi:hypothetical protein